MTAGGLRLPSAHCNHVGARLRFFRQVVLTCCGRREKNGGAQSAAKFREETSKKQGGITAVLRRTTWAFGLGLQELM